MWLYMGCIFLWPFSFSLTSHAKVIVERATEAKRKWSRETLSWARACWKRQKPLRPFVLLKSPGVWDILRWISTWPAPTDHCQRKVKEERHWTQPDHAELCQDLPWHLSEKRGNHWESLGINPSKRCLMMPPLQDMDADGSGSFSAVWVPDGFTLFHKMKSTHQTFIPMTSFIEQLVNLFLGVVAIGPSKMRESFQLGSILGERADF